MVEYEEITEKSIFGKFVITSYTVKSVVRLDKKNLSRKIRVITKNTTAEIPCIIPQKRLNLCKNRISLTKYNSMTSYSFYNNNGYTISMTLKI